MTATFTGFAAASKVVGELDKDGKISATLVAKVTGNNKQAKVAEASNIKVDNEGDMTFNHAKFSNCIFTGESKYDYIYTKDYTAEGVEFENADTVKINVYPASIDEASYTYTFKNINFNLGTKFDVNSYRDFTKDASGNPITVTWYKWKDYDAESGDTVTVAYPKATAEKIIKVLTENPYNAAGLKEAGVADNYNYNGKNYYIKVGTQKAVKVKDASGKDVDGISIFMTFYSKSRKVSVSRTLTDVPAGIRKVYTKETLTDGNEPNQWGEAKDTIEDGMEYEGFTVIFEFDNCKYNGKAMTSLGGEIQVIAAEDMATPDDATINFRYRIGSKLYRPVTEKGNNSGIAWLVEVAE